MIKIDYIRTDSSKYIFKSLKKFDEDISDCSSDHDCSCNIKLDYILLLEFFPFLLYICIS